MLSGALRCRRQKTYDVSSASAGGVRGVGVGMAWFLQVSIIYRYLLTVLIPLIRIPSPRHLNNYRMRFRDVYPHFHSTTKPGKTRRGCDPAGTRPIACFDTPSSSAEIPAKVG